MFTRMASKVQIHLRGVCSPSKISKRQLLLILALLLVHVKTLDMIVDERDRHPLQNLTFCTLLLHHDASNTDAYDADHGALDHKLALVNQNQLSKSNHH